MKRRRYPKKKKWGQFASPLEEDIWNAVARVKNKKFDIAYESELLKYFIVKNYKPDMILTFPDGRKMYIEVKGFLRYEDQVKMKAVKNANPELDIRFVFPEKGRVGRSNMTPMQWCAKYGFPCTMEGKIPLQWMKSKQTTKTSSVQHSKPARTARTARRQKRSPSSTEIGAPKMATEAIASPVSN